MEMVIPKKKRAVYLGPKENIQIQWSMVHQDNQKDRLAELTWIFLCLLIRKSIFLLCRWCY